MSWYHVGAKCICIKGGDWRANIDGPIWPGPIDREVCRIRSIIYNDTGEAFLGLEGYGDLFYRAKHFRPVAYPKRSLETDIAQFTPLLTLKEPVE